MKYLEYYNEVDEDKYVEILTKHEQLEKKALEYRYSNWNDNKIWLKIIKDDINIIDYFKKEGYWAEEKNSNENYPFPKENTMTKQQLEDFLPLLQSVQNRIKNKNLNGSFRSFMGLSICRCCAQLNGSQEYSYHGWTWPVGFEHYLVEHLVAPSASFVLFIRSLTGDIK